MQLWAGYGELLPAQLPAVLKALPDTASGVEAHPCALLQPMVPSFNPGQLELAPVADWQPAET